MDGGLPISLQYRREPRRRSLWIVRARCLVPGRVHAWPVSSNVVSAAADARLTRSIRPNHPARPHHPPDHESGTMRHHLVRPTRGRSAPFLRQGKVWAGAPCRARAPVHGRRRLTPPRNCARVAGHPTTCSSVCRDVSSVRRRACANPGPFLPIPPSLLRQRPLATVDRQRCEAGATKACSRTGETR